MSVNESLSSFTLSFYSHLPLEVFPFLCSTYFPPKKKNFQRPQKLFFSPPHHWLEVLLREYRRVRLEKLSETLGKVQDLPLGDELNSLSQHKSVGFSDSVFLQRSWSNLEKLENPSWVELVDSPILLLIQLLGEMKKGIVRWEVATDFCLGVKVGVSSSLKFWRGWMILLKAIFNECRVVMIDLFPWFPGLEHD